MIRALIASILSLFVASAFAQSAESRLKALADSLTQQYQAKQQKIAQFKSSRTDLGKGLIVDIKRGLPIYRDILNANAAATTGVSKLRSGIMGLNLEGTGFTIGVWDDGKVQHHVEFDNRVIATEGYAFQSHTTHVTGTLIATGLNAAAKGMAPKAKVAAWYFDNNEAELAAQSKPDQTTLLLSNHSYGQVTGWRRDNVWRWVGDVNISADEDFNFGFYGNSARVLDEIAYLSPYSTIVWAAGNDRGEKGDGTHPPDCNKGTGYDCIIPDAVGKNLITVGAADKVLSYSGPSSVSMSDFSSWGPTDDGRIKPDLVGDGMNVFSTSAENTSAYGVSSGTSMATPNVTGSLVLLQELYSKLHAGNKMRASTLKALAIHSTKEAGNFPGPDYSFGWGLLDVEAAAKILLNENGMTTSVQELTLANGENKEWILTPKANQKITATIAWTDPPGKPVPDALDPVDLMLVNDLDIKIIDESGNETLPWILDPGLPALPASKGNNFRDNIEKIEFELPQAKTYKLVVNHKKELTGGKQDFALILTYQSVNNVGQTYYWIGNTGSWEDPTHWAASSGGPSVNKVPTIIDNVIVDENSFEGEGIDQIALTQDQSVASLLWITSKTAGIAFNNRALTIGRALTLGSDQFQVYSPGSFQCASDANGILSFLNNDLGTMDLNIAKGSWIWSGDVSLRQLKIEEGALQINGAKSKLADLNITSTKNKTLKLINSEIELSHSSEINQSALTLASTNSRLLVKSEGVTLNWQDVILPATLTIDQGGAVIINGNNAFNVFNLSGSLELKGNNAVASLAILSDASISMAAGSDQAIGDIQIKDGTALAWSSTAHASVTFLAHKKYCFDKLTLTNVEAKGIAVVNAGVNSVLTQSPGWLSQKCEDVLFADFAVQYPCENGVTQFTDTSTGAVVSRTWTFPEANTRQGQIADFPFAAAGKYPVTLTVANANGSNSYTTEILIGANTLNANQIIVNSDELFSFNQAQAYQWYKNELLLPETNRTYSYQGLDGVYSVLTYDQNCNRFSDKVTIMAVPEPGFSVKVFPNPANNDITIESKGALLYIKLSDQLGRVLYTGKTTSGNSTIPVGQFTEGVYILEVQSGNALHREKMVISHH